jgi:hypothetical protein
VLSGRPPSAHSPLSLASGHPAGLLLREHDSYVPTPSDSPPIPPTPEGRAKAAKDRLALVPPSNSAGPRSAAPRRDDYPLAFSALD